MARILPTRRGRMKSEDERRIQVNSLYIEYEVDAKDVAGSLYASQVIDSNDRDEIMGGLTRLERTRRMIDILLLRGQEAFDTFLNVLEDNGYQHVATRLRTTEVMMTPKPSTSVVDFAADTFLTGMMGRGSSMADLDPFLRETSALSLASEDPELLNERLRTFEATCLSLTGQDRGGLADRLKKIEDLWNILSRRVTRIEQRVETTVNSMAEDEQLSGKIDAEELEGIKVELAQLKSDTMNQVQELTSSNTEKAALIEDLLQEVEQKTEKLREAHSRIEELEQRIELLESDKVKSLQEVTKLREELDEHKEHLKHQEDWFNAENLRMKNKMLQQETALKHQETKVNILQEEEMQMRQVLKDQQDDLKEQRKMMEEQNYQLGLLTKHMMNITPNNIKDNSTTGVSNKGHNTSQVSIKTLSEGVQSSTSGKPNYPQLSKSHNRNSAKTVVGNNSANVANTKRNNALQLSHSGEEAENGSRNLGSDAEFNAVWDQNNGNNNTGNSNGTGNNHNSGNATESLGDVARSAEESNSDATTATQFKPSHLVFGEPNTASAALSRSLTLPTKGNTNKSQSQTYNQPYHRTSFNTITSTATNNVNTVPTTSNSSTVSLSVPASSSHQSSYRGGSKKTSLAPSLYRGYNRRK